jgi:hypothetical protein
VIPERARYSKTDCADSWPSIDNDSSSAPFSRLPGINLLSSDDKLAFTGLGLYIKKVICSYRIILQPRCRAIVYSIIRSPMISLLAHRGDC